MNNNWKTVGEKGQNCVIGEFAKFNIDVAVPLSDNYPFDFIAIFSNSPKLFRVQVKTSTLHPYENRVCFSLKTTNFYKHLERTYTSEDCDVIVCYDLLNHDCYLLSSEDFENKKTITIRIGESKNGQEKRCNFDVDYIISKDRIKKVFGVEPPEIESLFSSYSAKRKATCFFCHRCFLAWSNNQTYCSRECKGLAQPRKVERPSKSMLEEEIQKGTPWTHLGKQYGVSNTCVKKWARQYGIVA